MAIFKNLFNSNERELAKVKPLQEAVVSRKAELEKLSDVDLASKTPEFRRRIENGETADKLLPEAFAVMRETARRVIDHEAFPVQILGGIVLHQGRIAEMQTGEGKTLVSTMPGYLNAVSGRTVHVITVNDYLARRDRDWMGQCYRFLGIPVGLVVPGMDGASKRASYSCPVIYGTNTEFGFDYLRDHMVTSKDDLTQSALDYAIIDEVDSILIDEARTPLIISGGGRDTTGDFYAANEVVQKLKKDDDYTVDEKARAVYLNEEGERKAESILKVDRLTTDEKDWRPYVRQALVAKELERKDVEYVVQDGQVLIVDEFTGRILLGRRFSDGLHEAIEAKEGVEVRKISDTLATVTVQNFFRMYKKLAGMTGTAMTEEPEFQEIYGLDVVSIPTNRPLIRTPYPDSIWKTERAKFKAVVQDIVETHEAGRPVLVGTRSVEKSEMLSGMLDRIGIPHEVLNAKQHAREAEIVAQAGRKGAVTIATNMAGRGTDILLGGNPEFMARKSLRQEGYEPDVVTVASEKVLPEDIRARIEAGNADDWTSAIVEARGKYKEYFKKAKETTDKEHDEVVKLGGLHIIGTERHEARRIDNQLRGRSGRQGDPGSSRFYLSLEDELMRLFGGESIASMMDKIGFTEDEPIEHNLVTKSVETAQKKVEARNFSIRKSVVEYDNVLNKQRETVYKDRTRVLYSDDLEPVFKRMQSSVVEQKLDLYWPRNAKKEEAELSGLQLWVKDLLPGSGAEEAVGAARTREDVQEWLNGAIDSVYLEKKRIVGAEIQGVLRTIIVLSTDREWVNQLREMEGLREGVGLQAYGQRDPLIEYTRIGFEIFTGHMEAIEENVLKSVLRLQLRPQGAGLAAPAPRPPSARALRTAGGSLEDLQAPGATSGGAGQAVPRGARDAQGRRVAAPHPSSPQAGRAMPKTGGPSAGANSSPTKTPIRVGKKVGRNDPCPCGSGKKYKDCCGKLS